jgi:hypothetical protein
MLDFFVGIIDSALATSTASNKWSWGKRLAVFFGTIAILIILSAIIILIF